MTESETTLRNMARGLTPVPDVIRDAMQWAVQEVDRLRTVVNAGSTERLRLHAELDLARADNTAMARANAMSCPPHGPP